MSGKPPATATIKTKKVKIVKGRKKPVAPKTVNPNIANPKKRKTPMAVKNKKTVTHFSGGKDKFSIHEYFGRAIYKKPKPPPKDPYVPNLTLNYGAHLRKFVPKPVNKLEQRKKNLKWINKTLGTQLRSGDELQSGVIYCQLFNKLYPDCKEMCKVKLDADLPYHFVRNFVTLKEAFKLKFVKKFIPVEALVTQKADRHYEFLDWFVKFYKTVEERRKETKVKPKRADKNSRVKSKFITPQIRRNSLEIERIMPVAVEKSKRKKVHFTREVNKVIDRWPLNNGMPLNT